MTEKKKVPITKMARNLAVKSQANIAQPIAVPTIELILQSAVQGGADVETLRELVALKKEVDAMNAERAFNEAFSKFQSVCPIIPKTKEGAKIRGEVAYKYAPLEAIEPLIKKPLADNGLSYTWESKLLDEGKIRATTCTLTHANGYKKRATFESGIDAGTSMMNNIQKQGSTVTYGERYSLIMVLGLVVQDEDDDGAGADEESSKVEFITGEQFKTLNDMLGTNPELTEMILAAYNIDGLDLLPAASWSACTERIKKWKAKHATPNN